MSVDFQVVETAGPARVKRIFPEDPRLIDGLLDIANTDQRIRVTSDALNQMVADTPGLADVLRIKGGDPWVRYISEVRGQLAARNGSLRLISRKVESGVLLGAKNR